MERKFAAGDPSLAGSGGVTEALYIFHCLSRFLPYKFLIWNRKIVTYERRMDMTKILSKLSCLVAAGFLLIACSPSQATTLSPTEPQRTPTSIATNAPTYTPLPTYTLYPTLTPLPSYTPQPTFTQPAATATSTGQAANDDLDSEPTFGEQFQERIAETGLQRCNDNSGGRHKVRIENQTGDSASLYLFGPENYACTLHTGVNRIYVISGVYEISSVMCGGRHFEYGSHALNATWYVTLKCP